MKSYEQEMTDKIAKECSTRENGDELEPKYAMIYVVARLVATISTSTTLICKALKDAGSLDNVELPS